MNKIGYGFIYNGQYSKENDIYIVKRPPIPKPKQKIKQIYIEGRSGSLTEITDEYEDVKMSFECGIFGGAIESIKLNKWLNGQGNLILDYLSGYYYKVKEVNLDGLELDYLIANFKVTFICEPFKFLDNANEIITITKPSKLINMGTFSSQPCMKIYGQGNISLTNNNNNIILKDIKDYITIDTFTQEAFKEGENCNNKMNGEPFTFTEENNISWVGNVSKIEIIPRWRSL